MTIHLTSKCDHIKSNWYVWYCTVDMPDGTTKEGTVQADGWGEMIAEETFDEIEQ